jgi:hypothetical protein
MSEIGGCDPSALKSSNILDPSESKFRLSSSEESAFARKNLRQLRASLQVAKKVGAGVG